MIKVFQTEKEYKDYVSDGLNSGEFYFVQENNSAHFRTNNIDDNDIVYDCPKTNVYCEKHLTFEALEDGTFSFGNDVDYSIDNGDTWITLEKNTQSPTVKAGSTILWKGEITPTGQGVGKFSSTCKFNAYGNVMSLLYGDNFKDKDEITANACFLGLFKQSKIVYAHNLILPAKKIPMVGYYEMFAACASLVTAPELPATELGQNCYQNMFTNCTSLVKAPSVLPATELVGNCYFLMFSNDAKLTIAPEISATTLSTASCGQMFANCTSLVKAPDLLATTLTASCYNQMFKGCTSLSYIKMLATDVSANGCLSDWVKDVAASGYFVKNENATWNVTGANGVPSGWTINT
jgi:hypothetical protein